MWITEFIMVLLYVIGACLIGLAIRNAWKGDASRRWPQTEGRVLRSFVLVQKNDDGGDGFTPQVEYEYMVEGTSYRGMRLRYGQTGSWNRPQAEKVIAPYPAGATVRVCFDPLRPGEAVLIRGMSWGNAAIAVAGFVFAASGYLVQRQL